MPGNLKDILYVKFKACNEVLLHISLASRIQLRHDTWAPEARPWGQPTCLSSMLLSQAAKSSYFVEACDKDP